MSTPSYDVAGAKLAGRSDGEIVADLMDEGMSAADARAYLAAYLAGEQPWRDDPEPVPASGDWWESFVQQPEVAQ